MPELPEVETMRRGILGVVGTTIESIDQPKSHLQSIDFTPSFPALRKRLCGRTIADVGRCGKRVLLHLDDTSIVVIEPRMAGLVLVSNPPTSLHVRVIFSLDRPAPLETGPTELMFWDKRGLGKVRLLAPTEVEQVLGPEKIGPDALIISPETLRERLRKSQRPIKVALLDQKAVAGIGNLYASEILHRAGVDPRVSCNRLSVPQWQRIVYWTRAVLNEAIEYEGSTLSDGTYRNALNDPGGYQNHHRVYDRGDEQCRQCHEGIIQRFVQAQRSTYFCPNCQQRRGLHPRVPDPKLYDAT